MTESTTYPQRIQQVLEIAPIRIADKVVQPVARLDGWRLPFGVAGEGVVGRLTPAAIQVSVGERNYSVPITYPQQAALRTIVLLGGAVSLLCLGIMLLVKLLTPREHSPTSA